MKMAPMRWMLLLSTFIWHSQAVFNRPNEIKLQNNEYTGVLVAIQQDIPEDQRIVDRLKEIFIEASQYLYDATKSRTFFKEIKILIPKTWTKKPEYLLAKTETYKRANVRVDKPNPQLPDNPYVLSMRKCGYEGEYMHLTPKYVVDKQYAEENWGPHGKVIVHEWGHLRWGLKDEYPKGNYPHFYSSSKDGIVIIEPTRCSTKIAGNIYNWRAERPCQEDAKTGVYESDCRFRHDDRINQATGSYMFRQRISKVTEFCHSDPEGDPLSYHNREAPNQHNTLCERQSAWDVMNKHQDFANGANPPREVSSTEPNFVLLQESNSRIVLVLDVSGSMEGEPIRRLHQVATRFIRSTVPPGTSVGVVTFSTDASIKHPVVSVNSQAVRNGLIAAVPTSTDGSTCIGCGLLKGIETLEAAGPPQGGVILLITDGKENVEPLINDVKPELLRKGVIVDTIANGRDADALLQSLALQTGGVSFFSGIHDSAALDNAFAATFDAAAGGKEVKLLSEDKTFIRRSVTAGNHVYVDNSVGENTTFSFSWVDGPTPRITLENPRGLVITEGDPMYHITSDTITIEIPGTAMPGKWSYEITNYDFYDQDVTIIVASNSPNDIEPIKVTAQVSALSLDYSTSQPTALTIFAAVRKGYLPVTGAVVKVYIAKPPGDLVQEITLLDNGAGADVTKNDGIYSRYFFNFSTDGRYGVSVRADNTAGDAAINRALSSGATPLYPDIDYAGGNVQREPLEQFQRMTTGGVFEVQGVPRGGVPTRDILPPSRVNDLTVAEVSYADATVTLSWTALGDDFDQGGPAHYVEIRYGRHFDELADDFPGSASVNHSQVLQGNLTSLPEPGSVQTIVILVPDRGENVTFVFALRTCDKADNCGHPSNIVAANLEYIPKLPFINDTVTWIIVGSVLVALAAGLVLFCLKARLFRINRAISTQPASANDNPSFVSTV